MKRRNRRRPSPALVVACLALFVALGGTVMAATKIDGKTIRVKSLPGNRVAVGSLPGNRLAPGSLGATQVNVGSLGQVPSAAHADSADTARRAQTATAADHATDASTINGRSVGCPELTREFAGACWDLRTGATPLPGPEAEATCASRGGELPGALPLIAFLGEPGVQAASAGEWLDQAAIVNESVYGIYFLASDGTIHSRAPGEQHQFRCVTPLLH